MITWEKKSYGFYLKFSGLVNAEETVELTQLARRSIIEHNSEFTVFVDMREIQILPPTSRTIVFNFAKFCADQGMVRSVVIYTDEITNSQTQMMSKKVDIYKNERYINSSIVENWEDQALNWLIKGIEPDYQPENNQKSASSSNQ